MKHLITRMIAVLCSLMCVFSLIPAVSAVGGCTVILNGESVFCADGQLALSREGSALVYASVKSREGEVALFYDSVLAVSEGMEIETHYLTLTPYGDPQARVCRPLGLRFVTAVSYSELQALLADENVKSIRFGTLIAPASAVLEKGGLTRDAFKEGAYLNVPTSYRRSYDENIYRDAFYIAGSIIDIKDENLTRNFTGVAYADIVMEDGTLLTLYAESDPAGMSTGSIAAASARQLLSNELTASERSILKRFSASLSAGELDALCRKDLSGLNVLAIGDSLFCGAYETVDERVWVNRLAADYGWNMTNLAIGNATVSYDPDREATNPSMYHFLTENEHYCWGDSGYYTVGTPSADPRDVDLILLEGGNNDYGTKVQAPMGAVGVKDPATFLGAWQMMTDELLERYPHATVVFVTAWKSSDQEREDNAKAAEYTSSVKELYNRVYLSDPRVNLIDAGDPAVSGVDMTDGDFRASYAYDRHHLNDAGMTLAADRLRAHVWSAYGERALVARTETEQMQRDLAKLNVLAIGDSLFYGSQSTIGSKVWMNLLARECSWNITNLGLSGATMSYTPNNAAVNKPSIYNLLMNDPNYCYGSRSNPAYYTYGTPLKGEAEAVDIILLQAGSNDYGTAIQAPQGEVGSNDPGTFLGAWRLVVDALLLRYPNATVVMITAWENSNQTREDNADAIAYTSSVVELYQSLYADNDRVRMLDAGDPLVSGVDMRDRAFRNIYAYDAFHLNDIGMRYMANRMLPCLWDLLKNDPA